MIRMSVNNSVRVSIGGSDNGSCSYGTNTVNLGADSTPEPKSVSIPSGSRSEIHYPGVQNPSRIYDSKKNRKIVRIMTVMAYMFAVSLAAIVLSLYYVFLWDPNMQIHNFNYTNVSSDTRDYSDYREHTTILSSRYPPNFNHTEHALSYIETDETSNIELVSRKESAINSTLVIDTTDINEVIITESVTTLMSLFSDSSNNKSNGEIKINANKRKANGNHITVNARKV